jgi:hypothetical protein
MILNVMCRVTCFVMDARGGLLHNGYYYYYYYYHYHHHHILVIITSVHGIYNYIPETNRVSRVYSVAAVLYLQFLLNVMLFLP